MLLIIWSIYLAYTNALILANDYHAYLLRKFDALKLKELNQLTESQLREESIMKLSSRFSKLNGLQKLDILQIRIEGASILLLWFLLAFIYFLGSTILFLQQICIFS